MTDLIDRNELLESFRKQGIADKGAIATVAIAPAVDAVPVVHGHWVADRVYFSNDPASEFIEYKCSECASYVLYEEYLPNYCSNCGAKMDEKDGEQDATED